MATDLTTTLQQVSVLSELPADQMAWLVEQGREVWLEPGGIHRHEGDLADCVFVMLQGELRVYQTMANHELVLATYKALDFFGELPVLTGEDRFWASGRAIVPCHIFELPKDAFWQLLSQCPSVAMGIMSTMAQRMQEIQSLYKQNEKLVALGNLAAGLAHEINNPASAILRSSHDLGQVLPSLSAYGLNPPVLSRSQQQQIAVLYQEISQRRSKPLDALAQSDREEELMNWLESQDVPEPWKLVPVLVSAGMDRAGLTPVAAQIPKTSLPDVLHWLATSLSGEEMLRGIQTGATRIFNLVSAIKDYSFMDQAPLQTIDVHQGLESTLTILSHRLKQGKVHIQRDYDPNLSPIQAFGGELNQVWTSLIGNAIDALSDHPTPVIKLRTYQEETHLVVEISDNGPGIPMDIQPRIFEAFFTTKTVGRGTGLGLDMTYRIIRKHSGDIYFESAPGNTRFYVRLPTSSP